MASFVPNSNFDRENSNPKDWAYHLGCLPQNHHIVFTKEDLVLYLKQHNISVGPNYTELSRLPKYATIGKLTMSADSAGVPSTSEQQPESSAPPQDAKVVYTSSGDVFRPSRKVRQLPGGGSAQVTALFGSEEEVDAHYEEPKPVVRASQPAPASSSDFEPLGTVSMRKISSGNIPAQEQARNASADKNVDYDGVRNDAVMNNGFRPTRRVRVPGGTGGLSSISFE